MTGDAQTRHEVVPFGKYLLDAEIARGGMARVFRARLRGLGGFEKKLVVKQILPHLATDPRFIDLFVREANVLVAMSHPGIVPVYELGIVDGVYFLAMEHVEGATLSELVAQGGTLAPALVAQLGAQIAEALHYAHDRFGLVHRDVTPRNVIVDVTGNARLLDFGIAAPAEGTATTEIFGSHGYMSPEQLRGDTLTPSSDVFSLGVTLFEALAGAPAFYRRDALASREALEGPAPALPESVPEELARVVGSAMSRDAKDRPQSAADVAKRLRGFLAGARPEGVTEELAARAEAALRARSTKSEGPATASLATPSGKGEPSGVVRTLAQSRALDELALGDTTKVGERASPAPAAAPAGQGPGTVRVDRATRLRGRARRAWMVPAAVAGLAGLAIAAALAAGHGDGDDAAAGADAGAASVIADAGAAAAADANADADLDADAGADADTAADAGAAVAPQSDDAAAPSAGSLTVNAIPWATARLDGRAIGNTPRRRVPLSAGSHVLELDCPPLGRHVRVPLRITAGATTSVVVDLSRDPPDVRVE